MSYKKTSAYLNHIPKELQYAIPYSDNSGDKIRITYLKDKPDIKIEGIDSILIDKADINWLIKALEDMKGLIEFENDQKEAEG